MKKKLPSVSLESFENDATRKPIESPAPHTGYEKMIRSAQQVREDKLKEEKLVRIDKSSTSIKSIFLSFSVVVATFLAGFFFIGPTVMKIVKKNKKVVE